MSTAFQISDEDVLSVLKTMGIDDLSLEEAGKLVPKLDAAKIEEAALWGDTIDVQTEHAHREIRAQLQGMGFGPPPAPQAA